MPNEILVFSKCWSVGNKQQQTPSEWMNPCRLYSILVTIVSLVEIVTPQQLLAYGNDSMKIRISGYPMSHQLSGSEAKMRADFMSHVFVRLDADVHQYLHILSLVLFAKVELHPAVLVLKGHARLSFLSCKMCTKVSRGIIACGSSTNPLAQLVCSKVRCNSCKDLTIFSL